MIYTHFNNIIILSRLTHNIQIYFLNIFREAACTPLTASIVADMFGKRSRGLAMSVFNWGIYVGYGLAFAVGNYVPEADILGQVCSN